MITVGQPVPDVTLQAVDKGEIHEVSTAEVLAAGTVVLFGVPAAFSPVCSDAHLPGFVDGLGDLMARGVDRVVCVAMNDAFVLRAWAEAEAAQDVTMLADMNGSFTAAMGLAVDLSAHGLGHRSQRYLAVIKDGIIERLDVEAGPGDHDVSSIDAALRVL